MKGTIHTCHTAVRVGILPATRYLLKVQTYFVIFHAVGCVPCFALAHVYCVASDEGNVANTETPDE